MERINLAGAGVQTLERAQREEKPLLRGWIHAGAFGVAGIFTLALIFASANDIPRLISLLIFGLSMMELFGVSALYHIGRWQPKTKRILRALDHANIFLLIAGTYTPLCFNVLPGGLRVGMLTAIWLLALGGIGSAIFTHRLPRWLAPVLYIGMGWVALVALPAFLTLLPWFATALLMLGGVLYTVGAVIYARKRPNPVPGVFGFHEVFHTLTVLGAITFATVIWLWALPFPRL